MFFTSPRARCHRLAWAYVYSGYRGDHVNIDISVNGTAYSREIEPRRLLCDFLRDDLGLTGTKVGCDSGHCGACTVEIDGAYFGGYVKPANNKENRRDRRLAKNQNGKRQCVVIVRQRDGRSVPAVFRSEGSALNFIRARVAKGTIINADEAKSWDGLHGKYEMRRINHEQAYSEDGACGIL